MICAKRNTNSFKTREERQDAQTIFALCVILFIPAINNFINSFFQIGLNLPFTFFTPIFYIFMAVVSIFFLFKLTIRKKVFIVMFIVSIAGSVLSYCLYPEIRSLIYSSPIDIVYSPVNKLIFFCIPAFMAASCIKDYNKLFNNMRIWSIVTAILGVVTYIFVTFVQGKMLQYMVYSYFLLLPVCVCFEYAGMNSTKFDSVVAVIASISMIACGARGAIVSLILYFVLPFFYYKIHSMRYGQIIKLVFLIFALIVVMLFYDELLELLADLFEHLKIDSRFISYLKEGVLFEDSGRDSIKESVKKGLFVNPFGYGIFGDRYVAGHFGSGNYRYVHNLFLEILCDFGLIIGSAVIVLVISAVVILLISLKDKKELHLVLALIPYALFQLLFSSSFLENIPFFVLMGIAFCGTTQKRIMIKWR